MLMVFPASSYCNSPNTSSSTLDASMPSNKRRKLNETSSSNVENGKEEVEDRDDSSDVSNHDTQDVNGKSDKIIHYKSFAGLQDLTDPLKSGNIARELDALQRFNSLCNVLWTRSSGENPDQPVGTEEVLFLEWTQSSPEAQELFEIWDVQIEKKVEQLETIIVQVFASLMLACRVTGNKALANFVGRKILRSYMTTLFRHLSGTRKPTIAACLQLLTRINELGSVTTKEMASTFEFGMKSLSKLIGVRKSSKGPDIRGLYIQFILSFFTNGSNDIKKQILESKGVATVCFKSLHEQSPQLIRNVLDTFTQHVVNDDTIPRTTKIGFFNTPKLLEDVLQVYGSENDDHVQKFLLELCTKPGHGVCFQDQGWVPANQRSKIHNPILASFITHLDLSHPLQQQLLIQILGACPELVEVWWRDGNFGSWDANDDKYLATLTLANKIISLPVPIMTTEPPLRSILANILPPPLHRTNLSKALQHNDPLVKYATSVALNLSFRKLEKVADHVDTGLMEVIGEVRRRVPDFQVIIGLYSSTSLALEQNNSKEEAKPLIMMMTAVLNLLSNYSQWFPDQVLESRFDFTKLAHPHLFFNKLISGTVGVEMQQALLQVLHQAKDLQWWKTVQDKTILSMIMHMACFGHGNVRHTAKIVAWNLLKSSFAFENGYATECLAWIEGFCVVVAKESNMFDVLASFLDKLLIDIMDHPLKIVDEASFHPSWSPMFAFAVNEVDEPVLQYFGFIVASVLSSRDAERALLDKWKGGKSSLSVAWKGHDFVSACLSSSSHKLDKHGEKGSIVDFAQNWESFKPEQIVRFISTHHPSGSSLFDVYSNLGKDILGRLPPQNLLANLLTASNESDMWNVGKQSLFDHDMFQIASTSLLETILHFLRKDLSTFSKDLCGNVIMVVKDIDMTFLLKLLDTTLASTAIKVLAKSTKISNNLLDKLETLFDPETAPYVAKILSRHDKIDLWFEKVQQHPNALASLLSDPEGPFHWRNNHHLMEKWIATADLSYPTLLQEIALSNPEYLPDALLLKILKKPNQETIQVISSLKALPKSVTSYIASQRDWKCWTLETLVHLCVIAPQEHILKTAKKLAGDALKHPTSTNIENVLKLTTLDSQFSDLIPKILPQLSLVDPSFDGSKALPQLFTAFAGFLDTQTMTPRLEKWAGVMSRIPNPPPDRALFNRLLLRIIEQHLASSDLIEFATSLAKSLTSLKLNPEFLLDKLIGHDDFVKLVGKKSHRMQDMEDEEAIVISDSDKTGEVIIQLVMAIFEWDPSHAKISLLPSLLRCYGGTTSLKDRGILGLLFDFEQYAAVSSFPMCLSALIDEQLNNTLTSGTIQAFFDTIDYNFMAYSVQRFDVFQGLKPQDSTRNVVYDPCFWLPIINALLTSDVDFDLRKLIETNLMGMALMALASNDEQVRRVGFTLVDHFYEYLYESRLREKTQLLLLLQHLGNAIVDRSVRIPTIIALFVAQAMVVMLKPDHTLYPLINRFLLQRPFMDLKDVPMFYNLFFSGSDDYKRERLWILRLLSHGLVHESDVALYERRHVGEILLSFYHSPFADPLCKRLIVDWIEKVLNSPAKDFMEKLYIAEWLENYSDERLKQISLTHKTKITNK